MLREGEEKAGIFDGSQFPTGVTEWMEENWVR